MKENEEKTCEAVREIERERGGGSRKRGVRSKKARGRGGRLWAWLCPRPSRHPHDQHWPYPLH